MHPHVRRSSALVVLAVFALLASLAVPGPGPLATPPAGAADGADIELVSRNANSTVADAATTLAGRPSSSAQFALLSSAATNLGTAKNPNSPNSLYLKDRTTKAVTRVDFGPGGVDPNAAVTEGSLSNDARYVFFRTAATNMGWSDRHGKADLFRRDLTNGALVVVDSDTSAPTKNAVSVVSVSANGRYAVLRYTGSIGGANPATDHFVKDLDTGAIEGLSVMPTTMVYGTPTDFYIEGVRISDDGTKVAFLARDPYIAWEYPRSNNCGGTLSTQMRAYWRDRTTGENFLAARDVGIAERVLLSDDGNYAVVDPTCGPTHGKAFRYDAASFTTATMLVYPPSGYNTVRESLSSLSGDGRYLTFTAQPCNWNVPCGPSYMTARYDWASGQMLRLFNEGRYLVTSNDPDVVFHSTTSVFHADDTNAHADVYAFRGLPVQQPPPPPASQTYGGGSGFAPNPSGSAADPVNTATGSFYDAETDLSAPGVAFPFNFTRAYNSADTRAGALGLGWRHNFETAITFDGTGNATLTSPTGQRSVWPKAGSGFAPPPGATGTLAAETGGWIHSERDGVQHRFDSLGRLWQVRNARGQTVTLTYDGAGNLASADSAGWAATYSHDTDGLLSSVTLADGRSVSFTYDTTTSPATLSTVTDVRGKVWSFTYDAHGRLTGEQDPVGNWVHRTTYDPATGRVVEQLDPNGNLNTFTYTTDTYGQRITTMTDARGGEWVDVYAGTILASRTNPAGQKTRYTYDAGYRPLRVTGPDGAITTFTYTDGLLSRTTLPDGSTAETTWGPFAKPTTTTDAADNTTTHTYNAYGELTSTTTPDGATITLTRDPVTGLVTETSTNTGVPTTTLTYDPRGQVTSTTTAGRTTTMTHDTWGFLASTTAPAGNVAGADPAQHTTTFVNDEAGHRLSTTTPEGRTTTTTYDDAGRPVATVDAAGRTSSVVLDPAGRVSSAQGTDPAVAPVTYTYDANGNLASLTDSAGKTATFTYDPANRLVSATDPSGTWSKSYDAAGRVRTTTGPDAKTTTITYDVMGRKTGVSYSDGTRGASWTYDLLGRPATMVDAHGTTTYTHDVMNRLTGVTGPDGTFSYTWDAAGRLTARTVPGGATDTRTWDPVTDDLLSIVRNGTTLVSYSDFDANGRALRQTLGNGTVEDRTYTLDGHLDTVTATTATGTPIASVAYDYDATGNPSLIVRDGVPTAYAFDARDQLTRACFGVTACGTETDWISWSFDDVGNRLTEDRPEATTTYTYDAAGRLASKATGTATATYGYDAAGNVTSIGEDTFTWNGAGKMTSATVGGTKVDYTYSGEGRRRTAGSTSTVTTGTGKNQTTTTVFTGTRTVWDPVTYEVVAELDGTGATVRDHFPSNFGTVSAQGTEFFHRDGLGSVIAASDATGTGTRSRVYEPYGVLRSETPSGAGAGAAPLGFTGHVEDPTGLVHMRARQYDPSSGLFLSPDPLGAGYRYGNNNPLVYTDPSGLYDVRDGIRFVRFAAGVVATGAAIVVTGAAVVSSAPVLAPATTVATVSGAVMAGTSIAQAYDTCTGGSKGSCFGEVITAVLATAGGRYKNAAAPQTADDLARLPVGRRGSPMDVPRGTNSPATIGGRQYGGHALDEMMSEGFTPSVVDDAIRFGQASTGASGRVAYYSSANNVTVIVENGRVVTVSSGYLKPR